MPMVKITGQGLFAIALSVALLWSCLIGERMMLRQAASDRVRALREIEELQVRRSKPTPVNVPLPPHRQRLPVALG